MKLLSVVVPCYNEEESVELFYRELLKHTSFLSEKDIDLELIYIDDGSLARTAMEIKKLR